MPGNTDLEKTLRDVRTPVERYLRRRLRHADSQEAVAETLRVLWVRSAEIPSGHEVAWAIGVARRVAANLRRGEVRRENLHRRIAENLPLASPGAEIARVREAMALLSEEDRELLRLWAWEGLEAADIAVIENCTPNAAAARLSRARKRLRTILTSGENSEPDDTSVSETTASRTEKNQRS
jgi:RNA polymerase sigma-70 factor (ECF subfamily)